MRVAARSVGLLLALALLAGVAVAQQGSDFLGDGYAKLADAKSPSGAALKRWISADVKPDSYESVLLQPVVFFPEPQGSDQLSLATLDEVRAYMDQALRREFTGVEQKSANEQLTVAHFKPLIDAWAKDVRATVESSRLVRSVR